MAGLARRRSGYRRRPGLQPENRLDLVVMETEYYTIRDHKTDEVIGIFSGYWNLNNRSLAERITKAEFDTYHEFGIKELNASQVIDVFMDATQDNAIMQGRRSPPII